MAWICFQSLVSFLISVLEWGALLVWLPPLSSPSASHLMGFVPQHCTEIYFCFLWTLTFHCTSCFSAAWGIIDMAYCSSPVQQCSWGWNRAQIQRQFNEWVSTTGLMCFKCAESGPLPLLHPRSDISDKFKVYKHLCLFLAGHWKCCLHCIVNRLFPKG